MSHAATNTTTGFIQALSSPIDQTCSFPINALDRFQNAYSSLDLSFDLSKISFLGPWLDSHSLSGKYQLILPDIPTMINLSLGISMSVIIGLLFATILYYLVLPGKNLSLRKLSVGALLLALSGVIPYLLIDTFNLDNTAVRFTVCTPFVLYGFKALEAVFGFVPLGAQTSLKMYCQYYSLPSELVFEEGKPVAVTKKDYIDAIKNLVLSVLRICLLVSFLSHYNYKPFGDTDAGEFYDGVHFGHVKLRHLGNCFFTALFFQQALALGDAATGCSTQIITGYKVLKAMRNPMLEASSPSDFWGRRWNLIVHSVMKRGVYKPVRKYLGSATLASLMVFIASGLFHEWLVHAVLLYQRTLPDGVFLGSNTAFFLWNFKVIMLERFIVGSKAVTSIGKVMPRSLVTLIIIMSSLPVAHWFGNPYLNGGFFPDYEKCLILLRQV